MPNLCGSHNTYDCGPRHNCCIFVVPASSKDKRQSQYNGSGHAKQRRQIQLRMAKISQEYSRALQNKNNVMMFLYRLQPTHTLTGTSNHPAQVSSPQQRRQKRMPNCTHPVFPVGGIQTVPKKSWPDPCPSKEGEVDDSGFYTTQADEYIIDTDQQTTLECSVTLRCDSWQAV
jgi:hypothetical protein